MSKLESVLYGITDNEPVYQYTISNGVLEADIITYGATLTALRMPDGKGGMQNVVLGRRTLEEYETLSGRYGATIGPVANRIEKGRFTLGDKGYQVECNSGAHCLHGGHKGFDKRVWTVVRHDVDTLVLSHHSPDGTGGFPGNRDVTVTYRLTKDQGLSISYLAVSDADTVINLTNHSYFNLNGVDSTTEGMRLWVAADQTTPVDEQMIPHNTFASVEDTIYDFRTPRAFAGALVTKPDRGYFDDNFVLNGTGLRTVAKLYSDVTGCVMEVITDQPGMQVFTGNPNGIALETQNFPNAVNCSDYPSALLPAGAEYRGETVYRFVLP